MLIEAFRAVLSVRQIWGRWVAKVLQSTKEESAQMTLDVLGVDPIYITVSDLAKSVTFYDDVKNPPTKVRGLLI